MARFCASLWHLFVGSALFQCTKTEGFRLLTSTIPNKLPSRQSFRVWPRDCNTNSVMSVGEPHFDDEQTLLSARRVVPLEKIDAKVRQRRHWLLGGAFALAMMLGAASALVASYLKLRNVPTSTAEINEVETPAEPAVVMPEVVASELPPAEETAEAEEPAVPVAPKKSSVKRRMTITPTSDEVRPRVIRDGDEQDELQRIREAVLFDSWQERRARRAARRERRNRVDNHNRDLSNLDEIFEGQRRRPPY